jgi:competence protein ComEA
MPSRPPWGWSPRTRRLLAVVALLGGLLLGGRAREASPPTDPLPTLVLDPNTAPARVLVALPRLGPKTVAGLIAAREAAPFGSLEDLDRRVPRVGPVTIAALRPHLRIEPEPTAQPHPARVLRPAQP